MAKKILIHGSGHKAASWKETVSCLDGKEETCCARTCAALLAGKTGKLTPSRLWGVCRIL